MFTSSVCVSSSSVFCQAESCWTLPSTVHLVTLTQWCMRSVTVLGFTTCFEVYQRSSHVMMHVWRLSPQWRLEICVRTPTPLPNTKAATILNLATKLVAVGISHIRRSTITWVMQVRWSLHMCFATYLGKRVIYSHTSSMQKLKHRDHCRGICWACVHTETGVEFSRDISWKKHSREDILSCHFRAKIKTFLFPYLNVKKLYTAKYQQVACFVHGT